MKTEFHTTRDLIENQSPLDLGVITDRMGINLVSVEGMSWTKQSDGQFVSLTIHFQPDAFDPTCRQGAEDR